MPDLFERADLRRRGATDVDAKKVVLERILNDIGRATPAT